MSRTIREEVRQRIHRDRVQIGDVAVTAVLFGFTLNLLSDFVTSIPESLGNLFVLTYRGTWALIASVITVFLLVRMIRRELNDDCLIHKRFDLELRFNTETGEPIVTDEYAQKILSNFCNKMGDSYGPFGQTISDIKPGFREYKGILLIVESIVLKELVDKTEWVCNSADIRTIVRTYPLRDIIHWDKSRFFENVGDLLENSSIELPGNCTISYKRESTMDKTVLQFDWNRGYHGSFKMEIRLAPVAPPTHEGVVRLIAFVLFTAHFSPVRLQFGLRHVENLVLWTELLMDIFFENIYSRILNRER